MSAFVYCYSCISVQIQELESTSEVLVLVFDKNTCDLEHHGSVAAVAWAETNVNLSRKFACHFGGYLLLCTVCSIS
jgi:hypothetical protein